MHEQMFHRVLIPADGSDASVAAARLGFRMARNCGAELHLVYVVDAMLCEELSRYDHGDLEQLRREFVEQGERILQVLRDESERMGLSVDSRVRRGDPFEEIVAHAREMDCDLIVMGHVGRRPRAKVRLGSVAERVIEFAPCPVMVVKAQEER